MPSIDETLGALEIGIILSIFLFGVFVVQLFLYSHQNNNDRRWLRSLIVLVGVLETTHTFCICILLYNITVTRYGIVSTISDAPFTLDFSGILSAWIGAVIQAFFAYRVRVISGRLLIPIISWSLSVLRMGFGVMIGVTAFRSGTLLRFIGQWHWLITTEFTISAVIDVLNTTSICFYLLRRRSQFHSSSKFVDRIILFSIETGLITSITVLAMLACALAMPNNLIYLGIFMPYAKLFSNSFMTSLNARQDLRQKIGNKGVEVLQGTSGSVGRNTGICIRPLEQNGAVALELGAIDSNTGKPLTSPHHPPHSSHRFEDTETGKHYEI